MKYLRHEIGHNAHNVFNLDEMDDWEATMAGDDMAVSWYVAYSRGKNERVGKKEDFAESFRMFLDSPAFLYAVSAKRYNFISKLFFGRMKEEQRAEQENLLDDKFQNAYRGWSSSGQTPESIREFWYGLYTKTDIKSGDDEAKEDEKI